MSFLTGKWENLVLVNYKIKPEILEPYIPKGTTLDLHNDNCYVSLVGFMFKDTKVLKTKLPYHIDFEEVNLRFYVKHNNKRGVVFIKELVPKPLLTFVANTFYKEHYQTCKMKHHWIENRTSKTISYAWQIKNKWQSINIISDINTLEIEQHSESEFITEHYYGYTKHHNKTYEYEIKHPKWKQFKIMDYSINVDFNLNYGRTFKFLNTENPVSVILAKGSEISVEKNNNYKYNLSQI